MASIPLSSLDEFAQKLGLPKHILTRYVFQSDYYYKKFRVTKRSGRGYRTIHAPSRSLKGLQRWIMVFILRPVQVSRHSTSFRKGCSIVRNASPHVQKRFVFTIDFSDFFPSISVQRVLGFFKSLGYPKDVSFALAKLTTYRGRLPQGAPTSPDIANLLCRRLDARLSGYCSKRDWSYTRYCDDCTISGNTRMRNAEKMTITSIIASEGFLIASRKTRLMRRGRQQRVTGLVVNDSAALPRQTRRRWRAIFHQARLNPSAFSTRVHELMGYRALLHMVNPEDSMIPAKADPAIEDVHKWLRTV